MKQSLYIYNSGDLKRKDNTLRFTNYEGEKRDVPIERISDIYVMSEMSFSTVFQFIFIITTITIREAIILKMLCWPVDYW